MSVGEGSKGGDLGDDFVDMPKADLGIFDCARIGIKGGKRADRTQKDGHRMGIVTERLHVRFEFFMNVSVVMDGGYPF